MHKIDVWKCAVLSALLSFGSVEYARAQQADAVTDDPDATDVGQQDPESDPATQGDLQPGEVAQLRADLEACTAERGQLVGSLADLQTEARTALTKCEQDAAQQITALSDDLQACEDNEVLNRRTNIEMNDQLETCRNAPPDIDPQVLADRETAEAEIERLTAENDAVRAENGNLAEDVQALKGEVDQVSRRLEELGFSVVPGFSYYEDDAYESALRGSDLIDLIDLDALPDVSRCEGALAWMFQLTGDEAPYTDGIWALDGEDLRICRLSTDGMVELERPGATDEAQIVFFR